MSVFFEGNAYIDECDVLNATIGNCAITTSSIDMNMQPIVNTGDPIAPQDVVTLNYLDSLIGTKIFLANNNQSTPAPITGLLFSNPISAFETLLSISIIASPNLFSLYTIQGVKLDSSWVINFKSVGEITGIVFSIESTGQVMYTSSNLPGFTSNTMKFKSSFL